MTPLEVSCEVLNAEDLIGQFSHQQKREKGGFPDGEAAALNRLGVGGYCQDNQVASAAVAGSDDNQ